MKNEHVSELWKAKGYSDMRHREEMGEVIVRSGIILIADHDDLEHYNWAATRDALNKYGKSMPVKPGFPCHLDDDIKRGKYKVTYANFEGKSSLIMQFQGEEE